MQKNKSINLYALAVTALLVAISIVLARFSVMIPIFGYPSVRFSVSGIPIFLAGGMFGPLLGAVAGFASDIINFMIAPAGPYHPGFTINSMCVGLIPGLIFMWIRKKHIKMSFNLWNAILAVAALFGALVYINFIGINDFENIGTVMGMPVNVLVSILMVVAVIAFMTVVIVLQKYFTGQSSMFSIDKILFICIVKFIVIQLILTPIWLSQLYNIPISGSIFVRVFKSIIDIPLQAGVIFVVFNALPSAIKGRVSWNLQ